MQDKKLLSLSLLLKEEMFKDIPTSKKDSHSFAQELIKLLT